MSSISRELPRGGTLVLAPGITEGAGSAFSTVNVAIPDGQTVILTATSVSDVLLEDPECGPRVVEMMAEESGLALKVAAKRYRELA